MSVVFTTLGWCSLFGTLDLEKFKEAYFSNSGFRIEYTNRVLPNEVILIGNKTVEVYRDSDKKKFDGVIEFRISKIGFVNVLFSLTIEAVDYKNAKSERFTIINDNYHHFESLSSQEITWRLCSSVFKTSIVEVQVHADLQDEFYQNLCREYGIDQIHRIPYLTVQYFCLIDNEEDWGVIYQNEKDSFQDIGGSSLRDTIIIPNFNKTRILPGLNVECLFSMIAIIKGNEPLLTLFSNNVFGIANKTNGATFLRFPITDLSNQAQDLLKYAIDTDSGISWMYIDEELKRIEREYHQILNIYETKIIDTEVLQLYNFEDMKSQQILEKYLGYSQEKIRYQEAKERLNQKIQVIQSLLLDKAEKEERKANERIVTVVGILTMFEIISQILPLLSNTITYFIRIAFLILFIPSLILIWFYTSQATKRKKRAASIIKDDNIKLSRRLVIESFIQQLESNKNLEMFEFSDDYIRTQLEWLNKKKQELEGK